MAEPIANDWKAIHDRMQQIKAEESASHRPCPQCNDSGWVPDYMSAQRGYMVCVCDVCHNPKDMRPPGLERRNGSGRAMP
jgi:hypothetical protein